LYPDEVSGTSASNRVHEYGLIGLIESYGVIGKSLNHAFFLVLTG
jgi:hypothetical protein